MDVEDEHPKLVTDSGPDEDTKFSPLQKRLRASLRAHEKEQKVMGKTMAGSIDEEMFASVNRCWEQVLEHARTLSSPSTSSMSMPWERGALATIFNKKPILPMPKLYVPNFMAHINSTRPDPATLSAEVLTAKFGLVSGSWQAVAKRIQSLEFHTSSEAKRQAALAKWKRVLSIAPEFSSLGRKLLSDLLALKDNTYIDSVISDVFANKATTTLSKRGGHILEFVEYCKRKAIPFLPLQESVFYHYLKEERATKSATSAKSSKESIAFSISTLGLDGAQAIVDSERIKGLCFKLHLTKRPTKQAKLLTKRNVITLERTLYNPKAWLADRVFAGHCLWCLFGRLRWSDSQHSESMTLDLNDEDKGFLESSTTQSKSSTTAIKRTTFLPQVSPVDGLESSVWPHKWLSLRRRAKLPEPGSRNEAGELLPMMPGVDVNGNFGQTALSAGDASSWLRELLGASLDSDEPSVEGVSSHALKSTTLAWVSKHGGATPYERKVLGYHVDSNETTMHIYSRDVLAQPLRVYVSIIKSIADGIFDPDSTRSGMFKPTGSTTKARGSPDSVPLTSRESSEADGFVHVPSEPNCEVEELLSKDNVQPKIPETFDLATSSEEDQGSSDESSEEDIALRSLIPISLNKKLVVRAPANSVTGAKLFHVRLKTLHLIHKTDADRLACGRYIHEGYSFWEAAENKLSEDYPKCIICFGRGP